MEKNFKPCCNKSKKVWHETTDEQNWMENIVLWHKMAFRLCEVAQSLALCKYIFPIHFGTTQCRFYWINPLVYSGECEYIGFFLKGIFLNYREKVGWRNNLSFQKQVLQIFGWDIWLLLFLNLYNILV